MGRARQAFDWAEDGKARSLHRQLAQSERGQSSPRPTFEQLRAALAEDASALLSFSVTAWGTLAFVVDPRQAQPLVFALELTAGQLNEWILLPEGQENAEGWREAIFGRLPQLSRALLHPLEATLRDLSQRCPTLVIVPDAALFLAPFAALTFSDDTPLIAHLALTHAPSAAVWALCRARRAHRALQDKSCLALGVGTAGEFSLAEQARAVAALGWARHEVLAEATEAEFWARAPHFSVLHLGCHGVLANSVLDALQSSLLVLGDGHLTAAEVFAARGALPAELVFLNACLSGRFRPGTQSEVGGFWRAFLHAGAAALVATLIQVHPATAQRLALDFYRHWLEGDLTKAEALRRAQLKMHRDGEAACEWASYLLIGDAG